MNHHHHHHLPPPFPDNRFFTPTPSFNPNPNPNPNFNSTFILPPPPPVQFNSCPPPPQPESKEFHPPDLSTSLSLLTDLIDLSSSTLLSLSSLLSHPPPSLSSGCSSRCAFNPNHLMPPESLFLHSLHCPSPIAEDVHSLIEALHYPKTLNSERQLIEQNKFVNPLNDPDSELCFSLDDYVDFSSNFFYHDCPGVVSSLSDDGAKRMFTLPGLLSIECANFASATGETDWILDDSVKLLPSEMWFANCESDQWSDFPNAYSYTILRAILGTEMAKEGDMLLWLIANSPCFGVIIDPSMRDHIFVLFRLCVKAFVREARRSYELLLKDDLEETGGHLNPKTMRSFSCQALGDALSWLATQLSVLYGEANAKRFTIGMLKQLLLNVASDSLVYPLDQNLDKIMGSEQGLMSSAGNLVADEPPRQVAENKSEDVVRGGIVSRAIFVYQVAVAIAALHERSMLEDKIKALRSSQYLTSYQRLAEHDYMKKKAEEERKKRQNYRPLVEHDGLPVQRQYDKDSADRNKSKEQLLAEERDYKRRRMSYRGKKVKRNVKEVMRDIIEVHMEAIREAGGIGCFDDGVEDGSVSTSKPLSMEYGHNMESNRGTSYEYEPSRNHHNVYKKHLNPDYSSQTMEPAEHAQDRKPSSRRSDRDDFYDRSPGRERSRGASRDPRNRKEQTNEYHSYPRSPSTERNYGKWRNERKTETEEGDSFPRRDRNYRSSRDERSDWKKENEEEDSYPRNSRTEKKHGQSSRQRSDRKLEREEDDSYLRSPSKERHGRSRDERSAWRNETEDENYKNRRSTSRGSASVHSGRKDKRRFEDSDRERRKRVRYDRSDSITGSEFDDRYAPSRSPET